MDQQFTAEQWKLAELPTVKAISDARGSARVTTEMLWIWNNLSEDELNNLLRVKEEWPGLRFFSPKVI